MISHGTHTKFLLHLSLLLYLIGLAELQPQFLGHETGTRLMMTIRCGRVSSDVCSLHQETFGCHVEARVIALSSSFQNKSSCFITVSEHISEHPVASLTDSFPVKLLLSHCIMLFFAQI